MKTKSNKKSELKSRAEQVSANTGKTVLLKMDFERRRMNRQLATEKLLEVLRTQSPRFWEVAEVVGKWVWVQLDGKQPHEITFTLSQLGFHWNNKRQTWQHPCGTIPDEGADYDPRKRYGSYFAADLKAAA